MLVVGEVFPTRSCVDRVAPRHWRAAEELVDARDLPSANEAVDDAIVVREELTAAADREQVRAVAGEVERIIGRGFAVVERTA